MELKRILAKDIRRATEKAVALYGKDVLFVSNSRVNGMTEVIVAVEVMPEAMTEPASVADGAQFQSALEQSFKALENGLAVTDAPAMQIAAPVAAPVQTDTNQRDYIRGREIVDMVRDELTAIRKEFKLAQRVAMWQNDSAAHQAIRPLVAALAEAGIPVSLRTLLVDHINEMDDLQEAQDALQAHLVKSIGEHAEKIPQSGIHAIAGPAGAGKTLMVARLAKAAAERKGTDSVAVISYSDQRAGAWSQIQMLCAQIGVDCLRAGDAETLTMLLAELGSRKLILIDTPGVEVIAKVNEVAGCAKNLACHLVLPADASATTVRKYLQDPDSHWSSLMVSRMDESTQPWPLIQILCDYPMPLSAASYSPLMSVPAKILSGAQLVNSAIKGLGIEDLAEAQSEAMLDEPAMSVMTAAQALVQRIEKMPYAS